ncbi:thiolase family protein [Cellulomonas wangsupingiae]|uniref:thiolase family protein n=1 Tax=Cellulomonas wangsupingiae TaxID=2968085 RepID=UPI001D0DF76F|nr:thiolase family protein [Cellulomonas wangsupingiae]MCM0638894.1 thiolase family protein [Cellulomonas wangsupingiae]
MKFTDAHVPFGLSWTSPFTRWQGPLAEVNSLDLAVDVTGRALADRGLPPQEITEWVLGCTVPQQFGFYGVTGVTRRLGAGDHGGPWVSRACATSVAVVEHLAAQVQLGAHTTTIGVVTDRTSNGPLMLWGSGRGPGGAPVSEHWVLDPMRLDPTTGQSMNDTAENTARDAGYTREQVDEVALLRYEQYRSALADDRAVQRAYMVPVRVPTRRGEEWVTEDHGVHPTTADGLARLRPVAPDGVVTHGAQTHPADGCAGVVVASAARARELGRDGVTAQVLATGFARAAPAYMPKAPVPAAMRALADAGVEVADLDVVTTHNPFAVNDLWFAEQTGFALERMNPYGSSLVYGHPQGPTGARALTELIHALHARGGGTGLFTGCAAGDSAGAVVVRVDG